MRQRYRLYRRKKGGRYYIHDDVTGKQDSTVNTRYGQQEDAAVGYNPHKRGRKSHHPLICVAARTRLCLHLEWRPGGHRQRDRLATGDGKAMESPDDPPTALAQSWRCGIRAGSDHGMA
jgi:hypothetical protein